MPKKAYRVNRKVIATTSTGEKIYLIDTPKKGQVVRQAWENTGARIDGAMKEITLTK